MFALFSMWNRTPGLKLAGVPVAPALHLELERSSGSRESDMKQLRSVVDYVSLTVPMKQFTVTTFLHLISNGVKFKGRPHQNAKVWTCHWHIILEDSKIVP